MGALTDYTQYLLAAQQQQYQNMYDAYTTSAGSTWITDTYTALLQPQAPLAQKAAPPVAKKSANEAWLDQRVNEMRVAL